MQRGGVAATIIWRMTIWGFTGGAGVGMLYGVLVLTWAMNIFPTTLACIGGFIFGGLVGGSVGLFSGFVLAGLTLMALRSKLRPLHYRALMYTSSALLTGTGALFGFSWFYSAPQDWSVDQGWILFTLIPSLIAVVVSAVATVRVTRLVENTITSSLTVE